MNGQWFGTYKGTNEGTITLELDRVEDRCEGWVYAYDNNLALPSAMGFLEVPTNSRKFSVSLELSPIDPLSGDMTNWDALKERFPGAIPATKAESHWEGDELQFTIRWETDLKTQGTAHITKSRAAEPSELTPLGVSTWEQFLRHVRELPSNRFAFRGQEDNRWRLRTHYHRSGRADLIKFMRDDIPRLHKHVCGIGSHTFNLFNPLENGAFYSLVQHHGYPTPLLDWTYSPFIAAYFAFRNVRTDSEGSVRIICFDAAQWNRDWRQLQKLAPAKPHLSTLDALAIGNSRAIPQQAISTVTNVDDIETYIRSKETNGKSYLTVIDLPRSERPRAMRDLGMMGITAGSLFPGLDGICQQLKEANFAV